MKKWRCSVCGYIHTGQVPPDKCPNCDSPKEKFAEVAEGLGHTGILLGILEFGH